MYRCFRKASYHLWTSTVLKNSTTNWIAWLIYFKMLIFEEDRTLFSETTVHLVLLHSVPVTEQIILNVALCYKKLSHLDWKSIHFCFSSYNKDSAMSFWHIFVINNDSFLWWKVNEHWLGWHCTMSVLVMLARRLKIIIEKTRSKSYSKVRFST